jgi:molecular chaperone HtpG
MLDNLIPEGIRPKLLQSPISGKILSAANDLEEHFRLAGVPFFKEYTDHSFQHSIDVFRSACDILTDRAMEVISSEDINLLLLSCILHDAGLHITEDTFLNLTTPTNTRIASPSLDAKSWPELWNDFLGEAKRFNAKKLQSLFGDTQAIREPPRSAIDMTQRDRLLIGEFLRRHHPRYAHDFANHAIFDSTGRLFQIEGLDEKTRDVAGLIARSHGLELRSVFDYIISNYDLRDYNRIHIVFLMVLLRIADYMQIQSARAPLLFGQLHKIRSPFSLGEWRVHQCITNVNAPSFDPEAISIRAEPQSVHEFLRFEGWINGLQSELDTSWAILGEVYGRFTQEALDKLQLRVRRLRSNIEDKDVFQKRANFVPEHIQFTVSEPELLKLLMEPLYGDNPLYGLRELTQNAADSVKELHHLRGELTGSTNESLFVGDIKIELSGEPEWCFTITDHGTGMTLSTIKNYFLRAGASFRNSELWKHNFLDEHGKSQIARTGRFGVGALSAYLIGETIEVYTRHYSDVTGFGYRFNAKIDEDEIEITTASGPIGTTVKIWSSQKKITLIENYLKNPRKAPFYYILNNPSLSIAGEENAEVADDQKTNQQQHRWIKAEVGKYKEVVWDRTIHRTGSRIGYLYCNGILVGDLLKPPTDLLFSNRADTQPLTIQMPNVLITDYDANLPLDLARKGLSAKDSDLTDGLMTSICEQFLSELFSCPAETPSKIVKWWNNEPRMINSHYWNPFLFGTEGFSLLDGNLLEAIAPSTFIVQQSFSDIIDDQISEKVIGGDGWFASRNFSRSNVTEVLALLRDGTFHKFPHFNGFNAHYRLCYIIEESVLDRMMTMSSVSNYIRSMVNSKTMFSFEKTNFCVLNRSVDNNTVEGVTSFAKSTLAKTGYTGEWHSPITFFRFEPNISNAKESIISKVWNKTFNKPYLPYSIAGRREVLVGDE